MLYNSSQGLRKLTDDEYYFDSIIFPTGNKYNYMVHPAVFYQPCFMNGNEIGIEKEKYDVDLYVRYANTNEYVLYQSFKNKSITFSNFPSHVVGYYFYIHDVMESIYYLNPQSIVFNIPNVEDESSITNFNYLEIYQTDKTTPVNIPPDSSYASSVGTDIVKTYDNNTYGRNMQRGVATNDVVNLENLITNYLSINSFNNKDDETYISTFTSKMNIGSDPNKKRYMTKDYKGYEIYYLLSEGLEFDYSRDITFERSYYTSQVTTYAKKEDGTYYTKDEYYELIKNHSTHNVIENWNNTNQTMIVTTVDLSDCPIDFRDGRYRHYTAYFELIESFKYPISITKDSILEYGNQVMIDSYIKPYGSKYVGSSSYFFIADTNDFNSDNDLTELFYHNSKNTSIITSASSNQDLLVFAKTDKNNYVSNDANVSLDNQYTYKLRVRNANNKITNLVIYDSIEKYIKQSGEYILASGGNEQFYGTFQGVNTSYAESQGYTVKVYYSENDKPGTIGSDSSWHEYTVLTDKAKVKSLAFEYLNSSGNKAVLPENNLTYVEIVMKSPSTLDGSKYRTYNGAWTEWNALDTNGQIIPDVYGINSNSMYVSLPATLKVKHLDYYNHNELAPENINDNMVFGRTYTTYASTSIPINYEFATTDGDDPYGTISKGVTEVIYYYKKKNPITTINGEQTATPSIDKRTDTVSYHIGANYSIQNYLGDYSYYENMTLPYEIDLTKSNLDGGTYNATSREITWREDVTIDTMNKHEYSVDHNVSVVYKNLPISVTEITANLKYTHVYTTDVPHGTGSSNDRTTEVKEKYKITVKHLEDGTSNVVAPEETYYKYYNESYEYGVSSELPGNYQLKTRPDNYRGNVLSEETVITYLYEKKTPVLTNTSSITGTESIDSRTKPVTYNLSSTLTIKDYIGSGTVTETIQLPYEIDTSKSNIASGAYNNVNKTITWTKSYETFNADVNTINTSHEITIVYRDIPISVLNLPVTYTSTVSNELANTSSSGNASTEVKEKYKITVKHLENITNNVVAPEETYYKYYNESYEYGISSELPGNYQLKTRPDNYRGNVLSEETVITYLYEKKNPNLTSTTNITGTESIDNRTKPVTYNISSTSTIKDYIGTGTVTEVIQLPYEIDTSKSNLAGGTYNNVTKTITWTKSYEATTANTNTVETSHEISVVYKNIPISVLSLNVTYESTITNDLNSTSSNANTTTEIHEQFKITVKHLEYGTNQVVAPEETYYKYYNDEYEYGISSELPGNYKLKTRPDNYRGNVLSEETVITYLYEKKTPILNGTVNITGPESVDKRSNTINYKIEYSGSVKDVIGEYNTNIVVDLPYEIDLTKSNLNGGTYNRTNNTITWNNTDSTTTIDQKNILIEYNISVVYKDVPINANKYDVKATSTLTAESTSDISESLITTNVLEKYKLVVRHLQYETNKVLATEETYYKLYGEEYNTSPSSEVTDNYTLKITPSNYRGSIRAEETIVTYYYEMIDSDLTTDISVECPEVINKVDEEVNIKITYTFTTSNYLGSSIVTINDVLPYDIVLEKSDLDGGEYNSSNRTVTWVIEDTVTNLESSEIEYVKGIKVVFKDLVINEPIVNNVSGSVVLENNSKQKETSGITDVKIIGNIIVRYIDIDTNESLDQETIFSDLVGTSYVPVAKTIEEYSLVSTPDNNNYFVSVEDQTLTYKYKKRVKEVVQEEIPKVEENPATGEFKAYYLLLIPIVILITLFMRISKHNIFKKYS